MDVSQQSLKGVAKVGLAAMAALFVLAIVFYKERVFFADAAYIAFHIINDKRMAIQEHRYGSFITQVVPYLGQKLHLSLKAILIGYGISFNLFFLSVNAILVYGLRQYRVAILMALYYFLFFSESFIWINEIQQGVAWLFLLLGVVMYLGNKQNKTFLLITSFILFGTLALFTHFVIIIPFVYLWVFFMLEKKNWPFSKGLSIILSCIPVIIIGLKFLTTHASYDSDHLQGVTHFSLQDIIDAFTTPVVKIFLYRCLVNYWLGTAVFITGIVRLIMDKEKKLVIWTVISVVGYIILMGLTYASLDETTQLFHIESEWSCMAIIVAAPFVFMFLPKLRSSTAAWLLAVIFVIRLGYIISYLPAFSERNNMTEQILIQMRKKGITKLALYNDAHLMSITKLYWGLPYESVFLSSMDGDMPQLTFLFVNPDDKQTIERLKDHALFAETLGGIPCSVLNKEYFNIDSTKPYQLMTYAEFLK